MIVIKGLRVNKTLTAENYKTYAKGNVDEYGNPFRIITLKWNRTRNHRATDYQKAKGFEDAVISRGSDGDLKITYRRHGSAMFMRPPGGIGGFFAEVPYTRRNIERLASCYGDKLWTIVDADVDREVAALYQKRVEAMDEATKKFNQDRIRAMHVSAHEIAELKPEQKVVPEIEESTLIEKKRLLELREQKINKREAELAIKDEMLTQQVIDDIGEGKLPVKYGKEYLESQKLFQLRKIAKEMRMQVSDTAKKDELVTAILQKQEGNEAAVAEKMTQFESIED